MFSDVMTLHGRVITLKMPKPDENFMHQKKGLLLGVFLLPQFLMLSRKVVCKGISHPQQEMSSDSKSSHSSASHTVLILFLAAAHVGADDAPQNRPWIPKNITRCKRVLATTYGLSKREEQVGKTAPAEEEGECATSPVSSSTRLCLCY